MKFDEVLDQVRELLQSKSRVAYRALKRRFELDDEYLEDLKAELIKAEGVAADENGEVLIWIGNSSLARIIHENAGRNGSSLLRSEVIKTFGPRAKERADGRGYCTTSAKLPSDPPDQSRF